MSGLNYLIKILNLLPKFTICLFTILCAWLFLLLEISVIYYRFCPTKLVRLFRKQMQSYITFSHEYLNHDYPISALQT